MEFLTAYDDCESEPGDIQDYEDVTVTVQSPPENRIDYFGLDDNDDTNDECEYYGRFPSIVDTLISAYQLSEFTSGPEIERETHDDDVVRSTEPRQVEIASHHCEDESVGRIEMTADVEPISSLSNGANVFLSEPRAIKSPHPSSSSSRLPRRLKWRLVGHAKCVNTLHWGCAESDITHLLLSSSMDGCVRIWNSLSGRCVWNRPLSTPDAAGTAAVRCARWSPTGRTVATGGYDKIARIVDVETGSELFSVGHQHYVSCLRFHPDERDLLICGNTGRMDCWDSRLPAEQSLVRTYRGNFGEVQDLEFLPGGTEMISCSNLVTRDSANRTIMAWDFLTGAVLSNQIFNERYHCTRLRVHPSGKYFLAQTNGNYVALFSVNRPYRIDKKKRFEGHKVEGYWIGCDVSPDGLYVYSGSSDGTLHAYDFRTSFTLACRKVSDSPCLAVECHPFLDSTVAISDMKGDIHIWQ